MRVAPSSRSTCPAATEAAGTESSSAAGTGSPASLAFFAWWRRARFSRSTTFSSRRRSVTSTGVAMKIDEYAPTRMPTKNSTSERSTSTPGPRKTVPTASTAAIGSRPMTVVLIERTIVWLTARFAACAKVIRPLANASFVFSRTLSKTTTVS